MRVPELPTFVIKDHYFLFKWAMSSEDLLQKKYDLFGQMRLIFMERTMCIDPRKKKKNYRRVRAKNEMFNSSSNLHLPCRRIICPVDDERVLLFDTKKPNMANLQ